MIKRRIAELVQAGIDAAQRSGALPAVAAPDLGLERPAQAEHGDYATSVALRLARAARMNPRQIADVVVAHVPPAPEIASISVAGQGFINIRLADAWVARQIETILDNGAAFGSNFVTAPSVTQVEFVSANPTGPVHAGNGRGGVFGDALASVLAFAGHSVQREYYINDAGAQIGAFARTVLARYRQALGQDARVPDDGYNGAYMIELAKAIVNEHGDRYLHLPEEEATTALAQLGMTHVLTWIRDDLAALGIRFDRWFSERSLFDEGVIDEALGALRHAGMLDQREGATWFVSSALGEDKDNVIIRSNGSPTYFATDIAYHYDKFARRKFDRVIDIWGADHQGHVSRMKTVVGALGHNPDQLVILLSQLVTLKRGGETVRLSKRTGDIITLREVIDEVGADACRFFFLQRSADSQMDFDLELAKEQSDKNPVYYVQYAHARIASILRLADERSIDWRDGDVTLLTIEPELTLARKLLQFPEVVEFAADNLAPHHLPHYAVALASSFHSFYRQCRVVTDDSETTKARLKLVAAAKTVLAIVLALMGVSAPERMDRNDD